MSLQAIDMQTNLRWPDATAAATLPHAHPDHANGQPSSRLLTTLMQRTFDRLISARHRDTLQNHPQALQAIQQKRQAALDMPVRGIADLRRKLTAMTCPEAHLLPPETDVERLLQEPAKAMCLCDAAVIEGFIRMRNEGLTLHPQPFVNMDATYVPYQHGKLDFHVLETQVTQMLNSGNCYGRDNACIAALNQLLESSLFNGCIDTNGTAFPLRLHLLERTERLETVYRDDFPALLNRLPSAIVNCPDSMDATPLTTAIAKRSISMVTALLRRGVDASLNRPNRYGVTPLLATVRTVQPELARALLIMGAEPSLDQPDNTGITPLHAAIRCGSVELARLLLAYGDATLANHPNRIGETPLLVAIRAGDATLVKLLLAKGAAESVNVVDGRGMTPLQIAGEHTELVMLLLAHGADLSVFHGGKADAAHRWNLSHTNTPDVPHAC